MKIAIVTGSRADRGPLEMVHDALRKATLDNYVEIPLNPDHNILGGKVFQNWCEQHLLRWIDVAPVSPPSFGSESVQTAAIAATQVSGELAAIPTDLVVVHGDRYEILGAVMGANMMGVPIAHLAGGDVTEGSADDAYRHAITKLSHLHFPNCPESAARIIQMGEQPDRVHMVGDPAVDRIMKTPVLDKADTFRAVGLLAAQRALLVSLHPDTLDTGAIVNALLGALKGLDEDLGLILIGPNADPGRQAIELAWQLLASARPNTVYCPDLPANVFLSLMRWCNAMVGNSSAALYEAPVYGLPAVNIGDRQKGRKKTANVIDCDLKSIDAAISCALKMNQNGTVCAYGDGHAAERIADIIGGIKDPKSLLRKRFQTTDLGRHSPPEAMGDVPERAYCTIF